MTTLTLEYWQDEEWFVGRLHEVPGCFSQGETLEELERNIQEVYALLKQDDDFPMPTQTAHVKTKPLSVAA